MWVDSIFVFKIAILGLKTFLVLLVKHSFYGGGGILEVFYLSAYRTLPW